MSHARRDVLSEGSEAYRPRSSGLLRGNGGLSRHRRRKSAIKGWGKNFSDRMLGSTKAIREDVPDFDPALEFDYTCRELMLIAEKMLLTDEKPLGEEPMVLNAPSYRYRIKHEIFVATGIPDPSVNEGLYWRTHPEGRSWNTREEMDVHGVSFYR